MNNNTSVPKLYMRKEDCCGCTACYAICATNAISMISDEEGFLYPKINENKCIMCNRCVDVCAFKAAKSK